MEKRGLDDENRVEAENCTLLGELAVKFNRPAESVHLLGKVELADDLIPIRFGLSAEVLSVGMYHCLNKTQRNFLAGYGVSLWSSR